MTTSQSTWRNEIRDLIRGASGGFLFGIPLLYTMEAWWIGSDLEPPLMLLILAVTYAIVFLLNRTDGFRQLSPDTARQAAADSVEALALGVLCTTFVLVLLREITLKTSLDEAIGKIIMETVPFAIGVAIARTTLTSGEGDTEQAESSSSDGTALYDVGASLIGTIIIAFNVAPTDEITMLAAAASPPWLLALIAASLAISYAIVFMAGFTTQQKRLHQSGMFQRPLVETIVTYLVSLTAAALMLWFFHRLDFTDPWTLWLRQTILLGLPATIGGAAGRLAV